MTLEQAVQYWKDRLTHGQPIYRVRVRRLLEIADAERRGVAIVTRIREQLLLGGLHTEPDFESAWIDGLVRICLNGDEGQVHPATDMPQAVDSASPVDIDPAIEQADAAEDSANVVPPPPEEEAPALEDGASPTTHGDPILRVSRLTSANNKKVEFCSVNDSLQSAITTMLQRGFSQFPVMQGPYHVKGIITWESVSIGLIKQIPNATVQDCMIEAQIIDSACSLFDALPIIEHHAYVLVKTHGEITGIVTAADMALELAEIASDYIQIGSIERIIDIKLFPALVDGDYNRLEETSLARETHNPEKLSLGEKSTLLMRPAIWARAAIPLNKSGFTKLLSDVVVIRNEVMHFNTDRIDVGKKTKLEEMETLLRKVCL